MIDRSPSQPPGPPPAGLWPISPHRLVDAAECACSVGLAIGFAHVLGASNVSWAAISGYMVMRGHVAESLLRGVLRIIGTIVGAGLALAIVPAVIGADGVTSIDNSSIWACSVVGAVVGGGALYGAITGKRAYAWLFLGLTFEMMLLDKLAHPTLAIAIFAQTRVLEVCAGTIACLIVSTVSTLTVRRRWPATRAAAPRGLGWHPHAARHAAQAAVALALLPWLWRAFAVPQLAQSAVTIMAVMLVPASTVGVSGFIPVSHKLLQRIAGCLAGAGLALIVLFTAHGAALPLIAGATLGVIIGKLLENGPASTSYIGLQFSIAILMTLVPDHYDAATIDPALERLVGILLGMALLEPILFIWHLARPGRTTTSPLRTPAEGGE